MGMDSSSMIPRKKFPFFSTPQKLHLIFALLGKTLWVRLYVGKGSKQAGNICYLKVHKATLFTIERGSSSNSGMNKNIFCSKTLGINKIFESVKNHSAKGSNTDPNQKKVLGGKKDNRQFILKREIQRRPLTKSKV